MRENPLECALYQPPQLAFNLGDLPDAGDGGHATRASR